MLEYKLKDVIFKSVKRFLLQPKIFQIFLARTNDLKAIPFSKYKRGDPWKKKTEKSPGCN